MRNWKNWLFPILTALIVAALALLPLRLSVLEDEQLTGTVHAEPLSEDSNFPFKPPELPGRLWLMLQWQEMPDNLTIMAQELAGAERGRENQRLQKALADLQDILPPELTAVLGKLDTDYWEWERYYLRDQTDLSSASFSRTSAYNKQVGASYVATLDVESGQIIDLQVVNSDYIRYVFSPVETGEALLNHLGLKHELADTVASEAVYGWATFRLPECRSWFMVSQFDNSLSFHFRVDWETVDAALAESHGYTLPADATSMQKS